MGDENKKLISLIEQLVLQVISEAVPKPEAPKNAPFGQYLFAPARADLPKKARQEEDTTAEKEFYHNLDGYYGFGDNLYDLKTILSLVKKDYYKKILAAPKGEVYRFLGGVHAKDAAKILRLDIEDVVAAPGKGYWVTGGGTITALKQSRSDSGQTQSWSTSMNPKWMASTLDHVARPLRPGYCAILLVADTSNGGTFFMNPKGVKNINGLADEAYLENEVISYGPVEFEEAAFICGHYSSGSMPFEKYWKELMRALGEKNSIGEE